MVRVSVVFWSIFLASASARASEVLFTFDFNRLQTGTLHLNRGSEGWFTDFVYAGKGTATVLDNDLAPYLADGLSFDTYCVDLLRIIYSGSTPQVQLASMRDWNQPNMASGTGAPNPQWFPWPNNPNAGAAAAYLYDRYRDDGAGQLDKLYREAGLQLAIWEALYEGGPGSGAPSFDIATGNVYFTGFDGRVMGYASTYLNGLPSYGALSGSDAFWLQTSDQGVAEGTQTQDFMGPEPVSEPETLLLVGSGVLLVAAASALKNLKRSI